MKQPQQYAARPSEARRGILGGRPTLTVPFTSFVLQISMLRRSDKTKSFGSAGDIVATVEQQDGVVSLQPAGWLAQTLDCIGAICLLDSWCLPCAAACRDD